MELDHQQTKEQMLKRIGELEVNSAKLSEPCGSGGVPDTSTEASSNMSAVAAPDASAPAADLSES